MDVYRDLVRPLTWSGVLASPVANWFLYRIFLLAMWWLLVPEPFWPYLIRYMQFISLIVAVSVITTFLQIRCGFALEAYIWTLQKLMEWSVSYIDVWEEEVENQRDKKEKKMDIRENKRLQSKLLHRDAIDKLRAKLRQRQNSGRHPSGNSVASGIPELTSTDGVASEHDLLHDYSCLQLVTVDTLDFVKAGIECVCEDELNHAMEAQELPCWNMLSRSKHMYPLTSLRIKLLWAFGFFCRYFILLPVRVCLFALGLVFLVLLIILVHYWPDNGPEWPGFLRGITRRQLSDYGCLVVYRIVGKSVSLFVRYHGLENQAPGTGMVVANHTAPMDVIILVAEKTYALTGQRHPGMLGFIEDATQRLTPHLWFERSSQQDRKQVMTSMREHIKNPDNPPILIFPEGVCVNNTAVVQFKKGAFEVADTVYPVAITYDAKYCDPFWYQDVWLGHLKDLFTSWAVVCDCTFLPPMKRPVGHSAIEFADEVKAKICESTGLRFLTWDGMLKMYTVKPEMKENPKREYSEYLMENYKNLEVARERRESGRNGQARQKSDSESSITAPSDTDGMLLTPSKVPNASKPLPDSPLAGHVKFE